MQLKISVVSIFIQILAIPIQSKQTIIKSDGNEDKSNLLSEAHPSFTSKLLRNAHYTNNKNVPFSQSPNKGKIPSTLNNNSSSESSEKGEGNQSWSSSSSSEELTSSTIRPKFKSTPNTSSTASGKGKKLQRADKTRLIKSRGSQKSDNSYNVKRSANVSASASLSLSISGAGSSRRGTENRKNGAGMSNGGRISGHVYGSSGRSKPDGSSKIGEGSRGVFRGKSNKSQQNQQQMKQTGRNVGGVAISDIWNRDNDHLSSLLDHTKISTKSEHGKFKYLKLVNGSSTEIKAGLHYKGNRLINKNSKRPYNVERETRPVDPAVYSFFQFKPSESIGFLWTQSAGFGGEQNVSFVNDSCKDPREFDDPQMLSDWESKRYDRACLYSEEIAYKSQLNCSDVSEEVIRMVDNQNEKLARRFLDWQFVNKEDHETIALKREGENHPQYLTYKFLTITMEIFRDKICKNATPYATTPQVRAYAPASAPLKADTNKKFLDTRLLPKAFIDDLYRLFLTLRDITVPTDEPDYATKKDEENIYSDVLEKCLKLNPIQWYSHTCADQVLSYDDPHNYACTPLVEYDFNIKEFDPILDGMWHMFTAVHGFCFDLFNKRSLRLWHKYSMIIVNSFTERMRRRWKASIADPKFYVRLLGPDYQTHLETMNRCMFAAVLRSGAPSVLPRFLSVARTGFERDRILGKDVSKSHPKT